jgi:hypothetical protein
VVLNKGGQQGAKGQGQGQQKTGAPSNNLTVRPAQPSRFKPEKKGERSENREIDSKEIQEKIRQTQAKLSGGTGKGKSLKAKHRRAKRDEMADAMGNESLDNKLQVTEFISVSELASLMDVSIAEIIGKCMNLGIMVSINQRLDAEVIELVVSEFGFEVEFIDMEKQMLVTMQTQFDRVKKEHETHVANENARVERLIQTELGKDSKTNVEVITQLSETFLAQNKAEIVDPLNLAKEIAALNKSIEDFETKVDWVLSESNGKTTITV